ncbi:ATP synthase F0 subunit B [Synechococcus sp. PCC 6312]|uniref:ATP synthase F0 subunit B n=1 Tax=Synechococcus sp. (strain ATCC 27167 / PCC 6312) TaxID=195253 RepID=UPI001C0FF912|nr:ATP synthase F0 subunit B [Synechococcus sp. PCC 6312]
MFQPNPTSQPTDNRPIDNRGVPMIPTTSPADLPLLQQLRELEELLIMEGVKIPLTGRKIIAEEEILHHLEEIEKKIPETVLTAERILAKRDEIISQAQNFSQDIVQKAKQKAAEIADELRIVQQAEMEAQKIRENVQREVEALRQRTVDDLNRMRQQAEQEIYQLRHRAEADAQQTQTDADAYAYKVLGDMENQFLEMLRVVRNGRQHLQHQAPRHKH